MTACTSVMEVMHVCRELDKQSHWEVASRHGDNNKRRSLDLLSNNQVQF